MENKSKCLTKEEIIDLKQAFDLFANEQTGKINPQEIYEAMTILNLQKRSPSIYDFFNKMNNLNQEVNFDEFIEAVDNKLTNSETQDLFKSIYTLFTDDNNIIDAHSLYKVIGELGDNMTLDEVKDLISKVSQNGKNITFEEFVDIMQKGNMQ